jgi:Tfp pilus assembly protein PilX
MPATESGVPKTGFLLPVILTFLIGVSLLSVGVFRLF